MVTAQDIENELIKQAFGPEYWELIERLKKE